MKTAFLYIRVSTDEQADTGYSQRHQDEMLRRYCEVSNISIKAAFFEDHSAKTFNRPEFTKLLLQLRKHRGIVDLVLFTKWDRFSRNAGDAYAMINTLNKLSVEPQAVEQPLNLEVPENKMMLAFYLAAPEVENDRRALNTFSGMRRAKKEGRWMGTAPLGYDNKITEHGKKYIAIDEDLGGIIKWAFEELARNRFTTESIWKQAKQKGLNTTKFNFWKAIRNPVYCGKIRIKGYKSEEEYFVRGQHEPLITEALFYQVQDVLDGKRKVQRTKIAVDDRFPLRGYLICPQCGRMLTASSSKGKKLYYSYYHCTSACGIRYKADIVNNSFLDQLRKYKPQPAIRVLYKMVLEDLYKQASAGRNHEMKVIRDEMTRLTLRQSKARELLLTDSMDPDDYRTIKRECEQAMIQLEAKLAEYSVHINDIRPAMDNAIELLGRLDEVYTSATTTRKREIVSSIFPEKLEFDGVTYRTPRINEAVKLIFSLDEAFKGNVMRPQPDFKLLASKVTPSLHFSNLFLADLRRLASLAA